MNSQIRQFICGEWTETRVISRTMMLLSLSIRSFEDRVFLVRTTREISVLVFNDEEETRKSLTK